MMNVVWNKLVRFYAPIVEMVETMKQFINDETALDYIQQLISKLKTK